MNETWAVAAKRADFNGIAAEFGIDPVVARCIRNRDVVGSEAMRRYLRGGLADLYDPMLLRDMAAAAEILEDAVDAGAKIRIIGDYDIDGIMSSFILQRGLERLGAKADVRIPERIRDGYGMNENLVRAAAEEGADLLLTCDNGISAREAVRLAVELGMTVIVTDHHEVPYEGEGGERRQLLPPAEAVIDPKREDCDYPFDGLCGAAVAWKLICALYERRGLPAGEAEDFLEFVAIATIGDVMDLQDENRLLVKEGLARLRRTKNFGLQELIRQSGLEPQQVDTYHVGFILGPCLNASGRLDTAERALQMLLSTDLPEAARLAGDLIALNASRKDMTERGREEAIRLVETTSLVNDRVLVVFLPDCHESLAGIIAGRLREHFHRPAFVLTRSAEGVKGSGRSIEAYSMFEELNGCADLLVRFGGHPMAAGLSLTEENVERFRERINAQCTLTEEDLRERVLIDVPMPTSYVTEALVEQLQLLAPFGKANPRPLFAERGLRVEDVRVLGKNRNVAKMQLVDEAGRRVQAVHFGDAAAFAAYVADHPKIDIVYYPGIDRFRGANSLQMTVTNYR